MIESKSEWRLGFPYYSKDLATIEKEPPTPKRHPERMKGANKISVAAQRRLSQKIRNRKAHKRTSRR